MRLARLLLDFQQYQIHGSQKGKKKLLFKAYFDEMVFRVEVKNSSIGNELAGEGLFARVTFKKGKNLSQ